MVFPIRASSFLRHPQLPVPLFKGAEKVWGIIRNTGIGFSNGMIHVSKRTQKNKVESGEENKNIDIECFLSQTGIEYNPEQSLFSYS